MIKCPSCVAPNMEGAFFCEECGCPLAGEDIRATRTILAHDPINDDLRKSSGRLFWGTAALDKQTDVTIHFRDYHERITLDAQSEVILGRADNKTEVQSDIDLTPLGALEKGVSRTHASIRRSEDTLTIIDLSSANGTYLNGKKVVANQPHILRDGDEVRFGKLVSHIYFK